MQLGSAGVCLEAHCGLEQLLMGSPFRWAQGSKLREKLLGDLLVQLCWGARCSVSDSPYPHRTCSGDSATQPQCCAMVSRYSFRMDRNCPRCEQDSTPLARALTSVMVLCPQGRFVDPTHCKEKSMGKTNDLPWGVWTQRDPGPS